MRLNISPASRLGRLPRGYNGKYDPAPMCRLVEWHPERRYTIDEIEQGLQLQPPPTKHSKSARAKVSGPAPVQICGATSLFVLQSGAEVPMKAVSAPRMYKPSQGNWAAKADSTPHDDQAGLIYLYSQKASFLRRRSRRFN